MACWLGALRIDGRETNAVAVTSGPDHTHDEEPQEDDDNDEDSIVDVIVEHEYAPRTDEPGGSQQPSSAREQHRQLP